MLLVEWMILVKVEIFENTNERYIHCRLYIAVKLFRKINIGDLRVNLNQSLNTNHLQFYVPRQPSLKLFYQVFWTRLSLQSICWISVQSFWNLNTVTIWIQNQLFVQLWVGIILHILTLNLCIAQRWYALIITKKKWLKNLFYFKWFLHFSKPLWKSLMHTTISINILILYTI